MTLPNVSGAMLDWFQSITVEVVTKTVVNFAVSESLSTKTFRGVMQPLSAQDLKIMPEALRGGIWQQLHAEVSLELKLDDIVKYEGLAYRVMAKKNYSRYGYYEYQLLKEDALS